MISPSDETTKLNVSDETTPLGVFLVKSDSNEEKLLFRYPYVIDEFSPSVQSNQNKYAFIPNKPDNIPGTSVINEQTSGLFTFLPAYTELSTASLDVSDKEEITKVIGITDLAFSNLFGAVNHKLCNQKFELKVDNVRFVGHPTLLADKHCFHVVFALKANAPNDVVKSYHELSQQIAIALKSEEQRCKYFTEQTKIMITCHDEIAVAQTNKSPCPSPYKLVLDRSFLAGDLKTIFLQLSTDGIVYVKINKWITVHFCLPQKVHRKLMASPTAPPITPANIQICLKKLRPYHTFLLLTEVSTLLNSLSSDVSPSFVRLIKVANPLKNLLELSADADITLCQVFNIVAQLVYWGKATIIFPLCETNAYMLHPSAPTGMHSPLVFEFGEIFPNESLLKVLSRFSLGISLSQLKNPMDSADQQSRLVQMVVWMLRKRLLLQLHTYILFMPLRNGSPFLNQRLSFNQSHPYSERPHSSLTDINDASTTASSYQSEGSFGVSPANTILMANNFNEYNLQSHSMIRSDLEELNKSESDHLSLKESSGLVLRDIGLSQDEISAVLSIPAANNLEDIRLFSKLLCYFDGHHHIEDIMYYENLRRSQILTLIDKFRDVLITCQYEDTTVAELMPYNTLQ